MTHDRHKVPMSDKEKERLRLQHREWISYIILHSLIGFAIGTAMIIAIFWLDINRLGTIFTNSDNKVTFLVLMISGFGSTFGMAVSGTAMWLKATEDEN